jgi:hypothetical protein
MAEITILFRGDAPGENATDFLDYIKRCGLTIPGWKDDDKIEYFELSLKTGSYARTSPNREKTCLARVRIVILPQPLS